MAHDDLRHDQRLAGMSPSGLRTIAVARPAAHAVAGGCAPVRYGVPGPSGGARHADFNGGHRRPRVRASAVIGARRWERRVVRTTGGTGDSLVEGEFVPVPNAEPTARRRGRRTDIAGSLITEGDAVTTVGSRPRSNRVAIGGRAESSDDAAVGHRLKLEQAGRKT